MLSVTTLLVAAPERQRFAVYFGGSGTDIANAVAVDADGNAYVAGQMTDAGGNGTAFVSKTKGDGSEVLWTTRLNGRSATGIGVDVRGNLWVSAEGTLSKINALDGHVERSVETESAGRIAIDANGAVYLAGNGFVAKYAGTEKVYSLRIGGMGRGLAVDGDGNAYVAYGTMVSRVAADGSALTHTTDLGWEAAALALDGLGAVYVTGANANVAKIAADGNLIVFQTQLRGVLEQEGKGIAVDGFGNVYVVGWTNSSDFAQARGWHGERDGFVARFTAFGELVDVTFAGTAARDVLEAVAVTARGDVYVAGWTEGSGLGEGPLAQLRGGSDGFLMKFAGISSRAITGTTTTLAAAPAGAATFGQVVNLTATVTPAGGTGKVTFYDGTRVIGVGTLNGAGVATSAVVNLSSGARSLRAMYGGDVNFSGSTSTNLAYTVNVTQSLTFSPLGGSTTTVGVSPNGIGVGDFNGDGIMDAAVVNGSNHSVSILLGNGTGGFTQAAGSPVASTGVGPVGIAVGDFNGDGRADFAVTNLSLISNKVTIFTGNGSGGFTTSSVTVTSVPFGIVAGDFNADGKVDLAVTQFNANTITILLGDGASGFTPAPGSPVAVGVEPAFPAIGDFNNDGKTDIAVPNFTGNSVSILIGNGLGGFSPAAGSPLAVGAGPYSVAVADLNGDGRQDLAVSSQGAGTVTTFLGSGTGTFTLTGTPFNAGAGLRSITSLDYDGDGLVDVAVTNSTANTLVILKGNGAGGFTAALGSPIATGASPSDLVTGDFNGDGRTDLMFTNGGAGTVTMIPGVGNAPFAVSGVPTTSSTSQQLFTFTARDANGATNMQRIYFQIGASTAFPLNGCHGFYDVAGNYVALYNDSVSATSTLSAGSGATIQNSQCAITGTGTGASLSGTDIVLTLNLSRQGGFSTGTLNVYIFVSDNNGNNSGWLQTGTWSSATGPAAPTLASVTPSTATAATTTFVFTGRDANGATDIQRIYFLVNTDTSIPAGVCHGYYDRGANQILLFNDALSALVGPLTPGLSGTIQNSQCAINGATSSVTSSGTDLVLSLTLTRQGTFSSGSRNVYGWVTDNSGANTGWVLGSTWTLGSAAPTLASTTPTSATANTQTFALTGRDTNGATDIQRIYFLVNSDTNIPAGVCHGYYDRAANQILLFNDALSALVGPLTPGAAGTIQNSQCAINGAASSVTSSGTDLVLNLNITRQGSFSSGSRNLYGWVTDNSGLATGWIFGSTWSLGASAPTLASASPTTSTTATQTFSLTARDANGATDVQRIYFLVNTDTSIPANSCHGYYDRAANQIALYNDALSALVGVVTPGVAGTIQNSQCAISGAASSVTASGTDVVLNINMTRQGSYATGSKNLYGWVTDNGGLFTGWVFASLWNL
jgi:hypothetical protein